MQSTVCSSIPSDYYFKFSKIKDALAEYDREVVYNSTPEALYRRVAFDTIVRPSGFINVTMPGSSSIVGNKLLYYRLNGIKIKPGETAKINLKHLGFSVLKIEEVYKNGLFSQKNDYTVLNNWEQGGTYQIVGDGNRYSVK